jgi:hypothetical protein
MWPWRSSTNLAVSGRLECRTIGLMDGTEGRWKREIREIWGGAGIAHMENFEDQMARLEYLGNRSPDQRRGQTVRTP